ncbi:MAG: hypothetical protein FJW30_18650 [Acidobacteria bacterium]|nr:hypothetical protein [Acidobacteriota bacterium]
MGDFNIDIIGNTWQRQPLGTFETRCDDKGRIRLPSDWLHFFQHDLKDTRIFCTSLDAKVLRIYPESIWRGNLALLDMQTEHAQFSEAIQTVADHYGVSSVLDSNGRILVKTELREAMGLLGELVIGTGRRGVVHVHKKAEHAQLLASATLASADAIATLTRLGMR